MASAPGVFSCVDLRRVPRRTVLKLLSFYDLTADASGNHHAEEA